MDNDVHPLLEQAAIKAVRSIKTKWKPGLHQGTPVNVQLAFTVKFDKCFSPFDVAPSFKNIIGYHESINEFNRLVQREIKYPDKVAEAGITGNVIILFEINEQGKAADIRVIHTPHRLLAEEVIRCIKLVMRRHPWKPAQIDGKPVPFKVTIKMVFKLQ